MKQSAPGAALICLLWLGGLGPAAAQYVPTLTVVRSVDSFHVLKNGEFTVSGLLTASLAQRAQM